MAILSDKESKKLTKMFNVAISDLLYSGSGAPNWGSLAGAAVCFNALQMLGLKIKHEKSIRAELEGGNSYFENFLEE